MAGAAAVKIELAGIQRRLIEVPVPPGNYKDLAVTDKALFWLSTPTGERKWSISAAAIANDNVEVKTVVGEVKGYELSQDGKKLLVHKGDNLSIVDAAASAAEHFGPCPYSSGVWQSFPIE